ncbi:hypothetical protein NDU88_003058 [Pleurodeles waltl]|uniref:Uncharacterized protein n=1 Tax=Pleurodeles waltl TaxID=8319 RepID=A0AAV7NJN8_PLEWA|nr:hypothetical protein NDU88_003058 [Pleurodeles waltl]
MHRIAVAHNRRQEDCTHAIHPKKRGNAGIADKQPVLRWGEKNLSESRMQSAQKTTKRDVESRTGAVHTPFQSAWKIRRGLVDSFLGGVHTAMGS